MPDVYGPVAAEYKQLYNENMRLAIQQKRCVYDGKYTPLMGVKGREMQVVELIGSEEAIWDLPDSADTPTTLGKHLGIYVKPRKSSIPGKWIYDEDKIKAAADYTSSYVQSGAATMARAKRDIIRDAIFGPRLIRATATDVVPVAVALDTASRTVAVDYVYSGAAANSGMTVPKWIKALEKIGITEIDMDIEGVFATMSMKQNTDLYQNIQVTSKDYRDRAVFEDKYVRSFMGVPIVIDNSLPYDAANPTHRRCAFWTTNAIHWAEVIPFTGSIDRIATKQNQVLIQGLRWMAATRSEDERVCIVHCLEA